MVDAMSRLNTNLLESTEVEDNILCFTIKPVKDGQENETDVVTFEGEEENVYQVIVTYVTPDGVFAGKGEEYLLITKENLL